MCLRHRAAVADAEEAVIDWMVSKTHYAGLSVDRRSYGFRQRWQ